MQIFTIDTFNAVASREDVSFVCPENKILHFLLISFNF